MTKTPKQEMKSPYFPCCPLPLREPRAWYVLCGQCVRTGEQSRRRIRRKQESIKSVTCDRRARCATIGFFVCACVFISNGLFVISEEHIIAVRKFLIAQRVQYSDMSCYNYTRLNYHMCVNSSSLQKEVGYQIRTILFRTKTILALFFSSK